MRYFCFLLFVFSISCQLPESNSDRIVARVNDNFLYASELTKNIKQNLSSADSAAMAMNFINTWAKQQLLLEKAVFNLNNLLEYDAELLSSAINKNFVNNIYKLHPFGNENPLPIFLFKKFKIIKTTILDNRHISAILKPNLGASIKTICFNCVNTNLGNYLLSYKNEVNVIANISLNTWNNKKSVQLNIKDVFI